MRQDCFAASSFIRPALTRYRQHRFFENKCDSQPNLPLLSSTGTAAAWCGILDDSSIL
jgi:hypothetical protein